MTTDAILLSLNTHATHSHGKVCFADISSMLLGSNHGANVIVHRNLCYISLVCLERTSSWGRVAWTMQPSGPICHCTRNRVEKQAVILLRGREGEILIETKEHKATWWCQSLLVIAGDESSGLQALLGAQAATAWEPTTLLTMLGRYEIRQLYIILPKYRCLQLQRSLPKRKQQKNESDGKN